MSLRQPLKRYKFVYQTRFNDEHMYKKILYACSSHSAWVKFNNYCNRANINLEAADIMEVA